jgi:catechol 2,3-dioxygenase-like lactoylglutathione lyase family enzyme
VIEWPALALAPRAFAQTSSLVLRKLHCFEMSVTDIAASVAFYQRLFGMPVQARDAERVCLRIGAGRQHIRIRATRAGETPAITQLGYAGDVCQLEAAPPRAALALEELNHFTVFVADGAARPAEIGRLARACTT